MSRVEPWDFGCRQKVGKTKRVGKAQGVRVLGCAGSISNMFPTLFYKLGVSRFTELVNRWSGNTFKTLLEEQYCKILGYWKYLK